MKAITSILHVWGFCSSALYSIAIQSVKCDCKQSIGSLKVQVLLQDKGSISLYWIKSCFTERTER